MRGRSDNRAGGSTPFPPPPSRTQLEPAQLCACGTAAAVPRGRAARADRALRKPLAPLNGWTAFRISLGQGGLAPTRPDPTPSADTAPRCFHAFLNSLQRQKVLRPGLCAAGYIFAAQGFLAMTFGAHGLLPACAADSVRARAVAQNTRRVFCASTFLKTSDRIRETLAIRALRRDPTARLMLRCAQSVPLPTGQIARMPARRD